VDSDKELDGRIMDLEHLHHLRWKGRSTSFHSDAYRQFHCDIARQFLANGWLRLFFLLDGGKPIAALYCFAYNGVYYYYQSGRDPAYAKYCVGFVLMNLAIQEAINEKAKVFDMLTGEELYKYRWADRDNICYHFLAFNDKGAYVRYHLQSLIHKFFFRRNHRM
jgi:CelD/BcsL family acetyltransferase involved in cellulose biosynthesis